MKIRKNYKKGVDEYKNAWYYMEAVTERGTLLEISKKKIVKNLPLATFLHATAKKCLTK